MVLPGPTAALLHLLESSAFLYIAIAVYPGIAHVRPDTGRISAVQVRST